MKERVIFQDFNELWANHVLASTSERMKNDQAEQNFWKGFMEKKIGYQPDPSSRPVAEFLKKIIKENPIYKNKKASNRNTKTGVSFYLW